MEDKQIKGWFTRNGKRIPVFAKKKKNEERDYEYERKLMRYPSESAEKKYEKEVGLYDYRKSARNVNREGRQEDHKKRMLTEKEIQKVMKEKGLSRADAVRFLRQDPDESNDRMGETWY